MLFLGDVLLLYASLFLALSIRNQAIISREEWAGHWPVFSIAFGIWIVVFYIADAYTLHNIRNDLRFYATASQAMATNILLAVAFFYILPQTQLAPKTILVLNGVLFFILFVGWRQLAHRWISKTILKRKALIIGNDHATVRELTNLLDHNPQYGYEVAAIMTHNADDHHGNLPDYRNQGELAEVLAKHHISIVVLDKEGRKSKELISNLYRHLGEPLEFIALDRFYESIAKRISLETIDQFWFLENLQEGKKRLYDLGKRLTDVIVAFLAGAVFLLLIPPIGLLILTTSGTPIFFKQLRLGKNGKSFTAIKFRTMVADAEKHGPQWAKKDDIRITPVGRFLRKTRLDEIPQLWNIFRGEMSFVGPRPERPEFVEQLEQDVPFYRERLLVKPGLTGWDQISGEYHSASKQDSLKKLQYDLYYIKNRSLFLDLTIILKTIKTVLSGAGR
ncbi:hypothetical protein BK004_01510 [bacterium CG10_46_32]|nr:MAG: hypothetical protein BK004_01510 [bacterium CG10_46_32]